MTEPVAFKPSRRKKNEDRDRDIAGHDDGDDGDGSSPHPPEGVACPLTALGERDGTYFFLTVSGERRSLHFKEMSVNGILSLTSGDSRWFKQQFPAFDKDGTRKNDWSPRSAAAGLMKLCRDAGLFDPDTPVRGIGVWRVDKELLVHVGDALGRFDPKLGRIVWEVAGVMIERMTYPAAPKISRPDFSGDGMTEAQYLWQAIGLWNFSESTANRLTFGWIAASMLGGAPDWRAHFLLSGRRGAGKSALVSLLRGVLGDQGHYLNNFTEAGVRAHLTDRATAMILDETEGDSPKVEPVIVLLRQMSSGDGVRGARGSPGQKGTSFSVTGSALLSAINAPVLQPQDRSRITEVELMPANFANKPRVEKAIAWADGASARLRARAMMGWQRFNANLAIYRQAILEIELKLGNLRTDARQADQLGTLLAAADMMLTDEPTSAATAADIVDELRDYIIDMVSQDEEESDARQCLQHLFTAQVEHWDRGGKRTVGGLLEDLISRSEPDIGSHHRTLRSYGLILETEGVAAILYIANNHGGLKRIFRESRWDSGAWSRALLRLEGAVKRGPKSFDGAVSRCVAVSGQWLPEARAAVSAKPAKTDKSGEGDEPTH